MHKYILKLRTAVAGVCAAIHVPGGEDILKGQLDWSDAQVVGVVVGTDRIGELPANLSKLVRPLLETPKVAAHVRVETRTGPDSKDGTCRKDDVGAGGAPLPVIVEVDIVPGELAMYSASANEAVRALLRGACAADEFSEALCQHGRSSSSTAYTAWESPDSNPAAPSKRARLAVNEEGWAAIPESILHKVRSMNWYHIHGGSRVRSLFKTLKHSGASKILTADPKNNMKKMERLTTCDWSLLRCGYYNI